MPAAMVLRESRPDTLWIGESAGSQWVRNRLWEVARAGLPVLILGEPGTGRRLAARLVHGVSRPPEAPFVRVDCGRLHAAQAEGVLFGGAEPGAFEQAEGGTLFLEEIEALPLALQRRVHQVLATGPLPRPGEAPGPVDVSARGCSSGWRSYRCGCRPCASAGRISRCWRTTSWSRSPRAWVSIRPC